MAKFLVTEIQTFDTGAISNPTYAYDDENSALSKYFSILSSAAKSALPVHACLMFRNDGTPLRFESFKHEA